jgi:tyrosyl-tRNA synthetase
MPNNKEEIIKRLVKNSAEIITEDELRWRLASGSKLTHYIGFEISGYVHIGQGIMSALVMKDLTDLGVKCTVWLADWHTWINEKLDGRLERAQEIGSGYFAEALKASFAAVGGDPDDTDKLEVKLASEEYKKDWERYWKFVVSIAQYRTVSRMLRSIDIMGREQGTDVELAKLFYPAMQAADIFFQGVDIVHAGMDQRKAHVIARDTALKIDDKLFKPRKPSKPIALHHPLLMGLQKPVTWPVPNVSDRSFVLEMKMSKSNPDSAIWIHDSAEEIKEKIRKAFCPEKEVDYNPILNWTANLLFWNRTEPFRVEREEKHGGNLEFQTYDELEKAYAAGELHPTDLKNAVAKELIKLLAPIRKHFAKPAIAAKKAELDKVLQKG